MATLILTNSHLLARHPLALWLEVRPVGVALAAVAGAEEARTQLQAHRPEVVVVTGHPPDGEVCAAVAAAAAAESATRVVYVAADEHPPGEAARRPPGIAAILTGTNDFESVLATLLLVLGGGLFNFPSQPSPSALPAPQAADPGLSRREHEVLQGIAAGRTTKAMARAMALSPKTVETYRNRLMQKLGLGCTADLIRFAVRSGLDRTE
ncbi:response regulator transcription factor [Oryzomicrobium sp.]|uniref:response regulator transcription factor n=1 Tax=Oryzomicrobium sp. TaxID=1911578 RepID=UPI002FE055D3